MIDSIDAPLSTGRAAMNAFAKLDLKATALLLDVDGTLIDIGPSPFQVTVSDDLRASLSRLYQLTGGAVALVSGRSLHDLDLLFEPLKLPAVGGHGAEIRRDGGSISRVADLPPDLRHELAAVAEPQSGFEFEDKGYSVALHYRQVPERAGDLLRHIDRVRTIFSNVPTELLVGKAVFEVKRSGIDKGNAVRVLMKQAPFTGRTPVFLGDDVTDETVFDILPELGGKGFSVAQYFPHLTGMFSSPYDVRRALQQLAGT